MKILGQKEICKAVKLAERDAQAVPAFFYSLTDGCIGGVIYADSDTPETILAETNSGLYFAAGRTDNHIFSEFLPELCRQRKKAGRRFTLFSPDACWDLAMPELLQNEVKQVRRFSFEFIGKSTAADVLPREYSLARISEEYIKGSLSFNEEYYQEYWGTVSAYRKHGIGYCILHNGNVVSECTSIFSSSHCAEMDIATDEAYRGQGLASVLADAFTAHCLESGRIPRWDCGALNKPSVRSAEKAGFGNPVLYSVFV